MGEPNLLKLKYRSEIHKILRTVILNKVTGSHLAQKVQELVESLHLSSKEAAELLTLVETEFLNLHEGNIARFKIRPMEFLEWKNLQNKVSNSFHKK